MKRTYSLEDFGVKKHETTLKNGLHVIFIEKPFAPIYAKIVVGAGSVFNPSDNGLAHFTEHIIMSGTKTSSKEDFFGIMESVGGDRNAFTARDWMSVNAEIAYIDHFPQMKRYFSEALTEVYITRDSLQKEKEIIFSEIQKARSNAKYDMGIFLRNALAQGNVWGYSNLGRAEGMNDISLSDVEDFFSKYYCVENMVLVIAGGCSFSDIERTFSDIPFLHGQRSILPLGPSAVQKSQRLFYEEKIKQSTVLVGFEGPPSSSRESYILSFAMSYAHEGMTSRFYRKIRTEKAFAYSVINTAFTFNELKYIGTEVGVPLNKVDETIDAILLCYREFVHEGLTKKEIEDKIITQWFSAKRHMETAESWVDKFGYDYLYPQENPVFGDFPDIYNFRETITPEEVCSVLKKYLKLDEFHLFVNGKENSKKYI
jgi:predicted Zn-dependent peptidase